MGHDLVVEDRDLASRRDGAATLDYRGAAVRQPAFGLALPVQLHRCRADDYRRVGVVGLERGQRLDRLAQSLLVGEERTTRVEHVADAGPLERHQLAVYTRVYLRNWLAVLRARAADLLGRLPAL